MLPFKLEVILGRLMPEIDPRSEPDSGKPTVRDRRGAYGNVGYDGARNPSHNRKSVNRKLSI